MCCRHFSYLLNIKRKSQEVWSTLASQLRDGDIVFDIKQQTLVHKHTHKCVWANPPNYKRMMAITSRSTNNSFFFLPKGP
jgi:hypothetical protein